MIYLLIILFAIWNGYVIRWKLMNEQAYSKRWYKIGLWNRVGLLIIAPASSYRLTIKFR